MEENTQKYFKYCLVPFCTSTTVKTPNKIFIRLPFDRNRRIKWLKACRRDIHDISPNSSALHVCEDHFNLEEDMENYMRFKLMGGIKKIKPDVLPHIFGCQPDRKRTFAQSDRVAALKRVKKQLVQETISSVSTSTQPLEDQNIFSIESNIITEGPNYENGNQKKNVSTQTPKTFCKISKSVQCKLYSGVSISLLPPPSILYKHTGSSPALNRIPILQRLDSESSPNSSVTEKSNEYYEDQYSESDSLSGGSILQGKNR